VNRSRHVGSLRPDASSPASKADTTPPRQIARQDSRRSEHIDSMAVAGLTTNGANNDAIAASEISRRAPSVRDHHMLQELPEVTDVPLMPVFCTQRALAELASREAERIVCVTHFAEQYVTANGSSANDSAPSRFMSNAIAMPAIAADGESATCEVKLAPPGTNVSYSHWVEPGLGIVEESKFGDYRLIRLTLPEHIHRDRRQHAQASGHDVAPLRHASFAGYSYLFRRQRSDGWTAVRYTNYVPGVIEADPRYADPSEAANELAADGLYTVPPGQRYVSFNHGRFGAWEESGPKQIDGSPAVCFEPARGRSWHPVCPAATGVGVRDGDLIIEAWYVSSPDVRVNHVENARQTPAVRYPARYGRKPPVFGRGTYIETATTAGMVIAGTASILRSEVVHDPAQACQRVPKSAIRSTLDVYLRRQVALTIDNIAFLLSAQNLHAQGVNASFRLENLTGIRVYLKEAEYAAVACEELARLLPANTPRIFLEDHVCRPGWLVEIEGLAWKSRDWV
jgi:hypothetical protein